MQQLFFEMIKFYSGDPHQVQHLAKVHNYAKMIGLSEKIAGETLEILEIAAIIHDIGIKPAMEKHGFGTGKYQELEGPPVAGEMLNRLGYPQNIIDRVCYLVGHHHTYDDIDGMDYQILVEADFLVNLFEKNMDADTIKSTMNKIFRTKTGIEYCKVMFGIQ